MLPTIRARGDWIFVDRLSHRLSSKPIDSLTRGQLVVYTSPVDRTRGVCKRIIGLPGDTICVDPFPDPGTPSSEDTDTERRKAMRKPQHIVVPEGHFWTQGDNRDQTRDSSTYGPVPAGLLQGQVKAIVSVS